MKKKEEKGREPRGKELKGGWMEHKDGNILHRREDLLERRRVVEETTEL